jgi:hypothetical protein
MQAVWNKPDQKIFRLSQHYIILLLLAQTHQTHLLKHLHQKPHYMYQLTLNFTNGISKNTLTNLQFQRILCYQYKAHYKVIRNQQDCGQNSSTGSSRSLTYNHAHMSHVYTTLKIIMEQARQFYSYDKWMILPSHVKTRTLLKR